MSASSSFSCSLVDKSCVSLRSQNNDSREHNTVDMSADDVLICVMRTITGFYSRKIERSIK